jgi:hypothetical protein
LTTKYKIGNCPIGAEIISQISSKLDKPSRALGVIENKGFP